MPNGVEPLESPSYDTAFGKPPPAFEKGIYVTLQLDIYAWPMIMDYRHGTEKLLVRVPLPLGEKAHE